MRNMLDECKGEYKIYVHVNKINGKIYIGQTKKELNNRFGCNGNNYRNSSHFWNAIQKYGWNNFEHLLLIDGLSLEMANIIEEELIKKYDSMNNKVGYNMMSGGKNKVRRQEVTDKIAEKNRNPSPETLRRMSLASKGRKHSPEVIEKIRKSNTGRKVSDDSRKKMSIAKQNMSEETRKKISEAGKGRKPSDKSIESARKRFIGNRLRAKMVAQYTLDGFFVRSWGCAMDVEKELGINHGNIGKCCNGNAGHTGGYQWRYYFGNDIDIEPYVKKKRNREINQYTTSDEYIKTWESVSMIERECGYHKSNIGKCCKGLINSAYGYKWRWVDELENNNEDEELMYG